MKAGAEKAESENLKDSIHGGSGSARLNTMELRKSGTEWISQHHCIG
jgi:hypothetical protein